VVAVARGTVERERPRGGWSSWWLWLVVENGDKKRGRISEGLDKAWCVVFAF
jgi:hypothetical protein